jgi:hypothetical protein
MKQLKGSGFGFFLLAASVAFGQSERSGVLGGVVGAPQVRDAAGRASGVVSLPAQRFIPPAVAGAPYSAEQIQEHVQTLNDGTHITQTQMRTKMYRDSAGRTRTERPLMMALPNGADSPTVIEITDAIAGVRYTLDSQNKIAHRVAADPQGGPRGLVNTIAPNGRVVSGGQWFEAAGAVPPPPPPPGASQSTQIVLPPVVRSATSAPNVSRPELAEEKLAPQIIEGVLAEGVRRTTTFPAGSQGNDRPFSITSETWTSSDLKGLMVLSKNYDPRSGESTVKLINISRNEPDASLFQPPPDYQIVDETGPFTVHYTQ